MIGNKTVIGTEWQAVHLGLLSDYCQVVQTYLDKMHQTSAIWYYSSYSRSSLSLEKYALLKINNEDAAHVLFDVPNISCSCS